MQIIDISLPIQEGMPVYPGTKATKIKSVKSGSGSSVLSEIMLTSHAGTHIDAPRHVLPNGKTLNQMDLGVFYGTCRVLDLTVCNQRISKRDIAPKNIKPGERLLFKTKNSLRGFKDFLDDFIYMAPDASEYLASKKVTLVGIDALSIKKRGDKDNTSHTALLSNNIPIIEGLNLNAVNEGEYILSAFPIALQKDGAPS